MINSIFLLQFSPFYFDRFYEFILERKIYYASILTLNILGYGSFFSYILILIFMEKPSKEYLYLDIFSLYTRLSVLVLFKFFEIPNIFFDLLKEEKYSNTALKTIEKHRDEILGTLFKNLFGIGFDRNLLYSSKEEIIYYSKINSRPDWKKIGKIYFSLQAFITPLFFWYILTIEN